MRACVLILLLITVSIALQAQVDSTLLFERAKGTLSHPVKNFIECKSPHNDPDAVGCPRNPANVYKLNKVDTVRAIYEGRIASIFMVGDMYCIITRFGDYFISYSGLEKPLLSKGDYVKRNQQLGVLVPLDDGHFELGLVIMNKKLLYVYPMLWIKQSSKATTTPFE